MDAAKADKTYEYLHALAETDNSEACIDLMMKKLPGLIPCDKFACLMKITNGLLHAVQWPEYADTEVNRFNDYYNRIAPSPFDCAKFSELRPYRWDKLKNSEFAFDFMLHLGIYKTIGVIVTDRFKNEVYFLSPHRSKQSRQFTRREFSLLIRLGRVVSDILSLRSEIDWYKENCIFRCELKEGYEILSKREAEVIDFLCRRLTMREIAGKLGISPRTVERHIYHIYQKLNIDNRRDLLKKIYHGMEMN